jgi:hypothetical protein
MGKIREKVYNQDLSVTNKPKQFHGSHHVLKLYQWQPCYRFIPFSFALPSLFPYYFFPFTGKLLKKNSWYVLYYFLAMHFHGNPLKKLLLPSHIFFLILFSLRNSMNKFTSSVILSSFSSGASHS